MLTNIYFAFVHPHILYGIEIYANTCPTFLEKLIRQNNKLLRTLQNKPLRHPLSELYCQYNTMPINMLHQYQLMLLVHKCQHHVEKMPDVFRNYFELNSSIHTHNTRTKNNIHLFRPKDATNIELAISGMTCLLSAKKIAALIHSSQN